MKTPNGFKLDSPAWPLVLAHISYFGISSAIGNAGGTTLVCADLANEPSYDGLSLKILDGGAAGQVYPIKVHATTTLRVGIPFTDSTGAVQQIAAGTRFVILSATGPEEGLTYYGIVDAVPGANQFTISALAGLGAGKFAGATNPYQAFVLRDAGGASAVPQGELLPVTAYVTATGIFTTAAFTAAIAVGDEILILHPSLASLLSPTVAGGLQIRATPIDLNHAVGTYTLFTGSIQAVILDSLVIAMPVGAAGGALTSISIQTDDATLQTIISAIQGAVANLTSENQLYWIGRIRIGVGKRIRLTIAGGATGAPYICNVNAQYRAVVNGGVLV